MSKLIRVVEQFSCPGPRYRKLGPHSGEAFKDFLIKEILRSEGGDISIDLDGTEGYGSSFLEESFGGLIRDGIPAETVKKIIIISTEEPELIDEINEYIDDAIAEKN